MRQNGMRLNAARLDLGVRPTPVEPVTVAGLDFLVKREDRCCPNYAGNKPRALQFLMASPSVRFLTYSTLSAHHAYATAVHAPAPCDVILISRGQPTGAYRALPKVAARIVEVGGILSALLRTAMLWRPGTRIIPPGGASARGAFGYVEAAFEIDPVPERIYVPLGSGTTVSGLLAGFMLRGVTTEIVAVRVAPSPPGLKGRARRAARLARRCNPDLPRPRKTVRLRVVKGEGAYGETTPAVDAAMEAARAAGLLVEPTYTAKTLAVLLRERAEGALFLNTYAGPVSPAMPATPGGGPQHSS